MQPPLGIGLVCVVVVCRVVVGGGGGGGAACVVVAGGGGGGAAWVVVVGGGAVVCVLGAVAGALCAAGFAWACRLGLCAGLACVVVVAVVDCAVAVVGAATLWVEVDEDEPQALTINVSRTAPSGMRSCFMVVSRLRAPGKCGCQERRRPARVASRFCATDLNKW
jgi:hypothetical protein